ncbi:MAG: DUF2341 domain-containing protein [Archaeoglobus sp.]|uniref:DUF2341 domain-containing protein n=1 Tax=Archaeoglobus sp. TaxID=1872626 RepID=UPI001E16E571|nr:DUF2341 domain-containing protein [Archaeoglobus sp.]MBO8180274.1 DUF2341 domain-containing protein [Archaeoglobus sp.]
MGWLSGWTHRRGITITEQSGSTLTDYQVRIELNSSNFDFAKANADGSDIRFTADDGETLLPYWIKKWPSQPYIKTWIKVPSIPAGGSTTIKVYYGNPNAESKSDGEAVFEFFDDFGVPIDSEKWDIIGDGTVKALVDTVLTTSDGDQGLAFDGEYWYWGHNNGTGVNGTIYKIDSSGNVVASFDGPPHAAGGDYRWDRGTILFSSGGDETPVVWEISKDGQKLREWDFSGEGYNRGALVAYEGDNKILLFTSDSSGNFKIGEYVINDDGTWSSTGNEWSHSSLGTSQGLDYHNGHVYYLVGDGDGSSTKVFKLKLNADGTISMVASASLPDGYEAEGLVYYNGEIFFGRSDHTIYKVSQVSIDISSYSTSIYSKDQFSTMMALVCKWRASSVTLDYPGFGYGNKGSPAPDIVDDSYQGHGITIGKIHAANDYVQGRQTDDGTNRDETENLGVDQSEYHIYEIRRYADYSKFYVDGELVASLDQNYPTEDLYVGIGGHTHSETGQSIADYIYVRKIAEQDPEISVGPEQSSDLQGWAYMREITITNPNSTELTDFQIPVILAGYNVVTNDGRDLRFYSSDGQTEMPYYVEEVNKASESIAEIWVKVSSVPANGSVDLYLYYGNPNAESKSDGEAVFEFYDDFDSGALDTTKWDSAGTVTISDGIVKIDSGNGYIKTKDTFGNSTLHFRLKMDGRKYNIGYGDKFDSPQIYVLLRDDGTSYGLYNRNSTADNKVTIQLTTPDEFHWYELKFGPNESSLCQDGTNCVTNSSYLPDQELYIGFQPWGSYTGPLYVDTVFVRKYAEQEPSVSVESEETQAGIEHTISLSDEIQLSHADKRDLSLSSKEILILIDNSHYHSILIKLLSDNVLLNEDIIKQVELLNLLSDDIPLYETIDKQADLYNTILSSISLSESKKDKISLSLDDALTLNELVYYSSTFYELLQENIGLQENFNAGFLFEQAISDIISISEQLNLLVGINPKDSLFTLEKAIHDINIKLKEEVDLSESAEIKRVLIALLSEVIALNEIANYLYSALMQKKEALNLSEKQINRLELALSSTIALSEDLAKSLSIIYKDGITISELSKLSLVASLITDILLSENVKRDTKVKILSLLKIDEKVISYLGLIPHEERTLYSLIVLSKLLYSLIKTEEEL